MVINKETKSAVILNILLSLNEGQSGYINQRVNNAIEQYNQLVEAGIFEEEDTPC